MNAAHAVLFLEFFKPVLQACAAALTFSVGVYALARPRSTALSLLGFACFVTTFVDVVYLSGSLHTHWKIILFPLAVRRVLCLLAELLFIVEVFLWPVVLFLLIRERRATIPPRIHLTSRSSKPPTGGKLST
jgi:hypothetical protein